MPELLQSQIPWLTPPWSIPGAILIVMASAVVLAYGAEWTVDASVRIANRLGIPPRVIGLTLVAAGTSAPEFAVSITAAAEGSGDIAISNVVGSNIFNLGFILGGIALIRPLSIDRVMVWRDGTVLLLSSVAVWLLFGIDLGVEQSNGALLLLGLFAYLAFLTSTAREAPPVAEGRGTDSRRELARAAPKLLLGVLMIAMSSELLVEAASSVAGDMGVSDWVIGMTIVAAGTSLPEFTTSLIAAVRGHHGLSLGNIIGSDIFNVLGVLGLTAMIHPITIKPEASGAILALMGMVVLTIIFLRTGWRLRRWEGGILVFVGVLRWVVDFTS